MYTEYIKKQLSETFSADDFLDDIITPSEVFASLQKYGSGNILKFSPVEKIRDAGTKFKVYYVDLYFKKMNGKLSKIYLELENQVLGSNASMSKFAEDPKKCNILYLVLRGFSKEELLNNNLFPKNSEIINEIYESCLRNVSAIKVLSDEYKILVNELSKNKKKHCVVLEQENGETFEFKGAKNFNVNMIEQTYFTDEKSGETDDLKFPLIRLKLRSDQETGLIQKRRRDKMMEPIIYDLTKSKLSKISDESDDIFEPAVIKKNGKICELNKENVGEFVTFGSFCLMKIRIGPCILSSQGWSLDTYIFEMIVRSHKHKKINVSFKKKSIKKMVSLCVPKSVESDDDEKIDDYVDESVRSDNDEMVDDEMNDDNIFFEGEDE